MAPSERQGYHGFTADSAPTRSQGSHQRSPRRAYAEPILGRYRSHSRVSDLEPWGSQGAVGSWANFDDLENIRAESSSSDGGLHPSNRPPPRHTRSMSHPFPSLFSSKKKKAAPAPGDDGFATDSDDDSGPSPNAGGNPAAPRGHHRDGSSAGNRDWVTGRCMTCASLMRWSKDLLMFKCTICLTINDLHPAARVPRREDTQEQTNAPGAPISLSYTKELVEQCLRSFLVSTLRRHRTADGSGGGGQEPPAIPSRPSPDGNRIPVSSSGTPMTLRPKLSVNDQLRPPADGPRRPAQHGRAPSWGGTASNSNSTPFGEQRPRARDMPPQARGSQHNRPLPSPGAEARRVFRPLEDYIVKCFTSFHCLNSSFMTPRSHPRDRHEADEVRRRPSEQRPTPEPRPEPRREPQNIGYFVPELEPKLLLLGDIAENGTWWAGGQEEVSAGRIAPSRSQIGHSLVSSRNPHVNWAEMEEWYTTVTEAARPWSDVYQKLVYEKPALAIPPARRYDIEAQILVGQEYAQRALLKACESVLKRPGRRITRPEELRLLLIIAANPLLQSSYNPYAGKFPHPDRPQTGVAPRGTAPASGLNSNIIKRIVGIMSNAPVECHNHLVAWLARCPESFFVKTKDLVAGFLAYRLNRQNEKKYETRVDITGGLVPNMGAGQSSASLHAALRPTQGAIKKQKEKTKKVVYREDWQIKAAAKVLSFIFAANSMGYDRRTLANPAGNPSNSTRESPRVQNQVFASSDFYVTLLDDSDLVFDFEAWERKNGLFAFCQYPFLLSIGAKIQILEHDARRQMETKARDAFFDSILSNRVAQQFLVLSIRRKCLVDDSLKAVSEVVGGGGEDIKKGLKIVFKGEEGIDAGGLRKEWFLLLVRELFNPDHGMFLYDEDSQFCYFNPHSLEPSEQFFLVGVVLGLAIYNSTILDVALPPFAFRKLLFAAPPPQISTSQPRQSMSYTVDDLAEYRPGLARGLRQLLDYDGDVESTFCLDFAIDTTRYGAVEQVALCPGGLHRPVTNANRREYVDAYVRHLLDTSVSRQFEPFKRGFFTVCGGNALSLFRPEEIDLLVRGSGTQDEPIDIAALKAVAQYDGWGAGGRGGEDLVEREPTLRWFWEAFEGAEPKEQRRLLAFVTGSDRLPAMGAASLVMRVNCLGEDCGRFPTARTCFNMLGLWRCRGRERLERVLWRAVRESEGFGLR
ncbi:HECT-domain-containing protein [Trichocladium antarcticum]|uniref:HECT-type E3 ubiquitin transferase n=1 Tax=Trichocladium antarcticum TaxID=1450529 RepID=A0AAN6UHE6_9PEZI|nr:HECT-domain-containing protein [Trichocladium antarcticum]